MPKVKISEYSATANSNTDVASINIDEGCAPSGINNAIRAVMGHLKDFQQGTNGDPFNGPVNGTLGATTASTAVVTTLNSTDATDASSTTAAAMKTAGGLGVAKKMFVGLDANIYGLTVGRGAGAVATNTAVGASALAGSNSGTGVNTAVGNSALLTNSTGYYNTAIGAKHPANYFSALESNTTGNSNIAVGTAALGSNTTGSSNTALGFAALPLNTTASRNTAVGYQAGYSNATGPYNIFIGHKAGYSATTGGNLFIGDSAGYSCTTGDANTIIGTISSAGVNPAGYSLTTGSFNSFIGGASGNSNTTGSYNVALGNYSLNSNTTASNNTAVGYQAGYSTTTGIESVYIGQGSGYSATTNGQNTFVGRNSGYSTTGGFNNFFGYGAGNAITSGTKNTIVGRYDGNYGGLDIRTASNYIVLSDGDGNPRGYFTNAGAFHVPTMAVGGTANMHWSSTAGQLFVTSSSRRFKHDIVEYDKGLAELMQMQPKYFVYNDEPNQKQRAGFIAEDFHDLGMTEYVEYWKDDEGNDTPSEIGYSNMVAILVKAIQELKAEVDSLKAQINGASA